MHVHYLHAPIAYTYVSYYVAWWVSLVEHYYNKDVQNWGRQEIGIIYLKSPPPWQDVSFKIMNEWLLH